MKIDSIKDWKSCLQQVIATKALDSFGVQMNGKDIHVMHFKKKSQSKGFSPLTLEKIVDITKQLQSGKKIKDVSLGLVIGKVSFIKETEGKEIESLEYSLLTRFLAIWNRFCNLLNRGEFKTGGEIAQAYARHLLTFDQFPSSITQNIQECIKNPQAKVVTWKEASKVHKQLLQAAGKKATKKQAVFMKFLGVWLLTGKSILESIALGKSSLGVEVLGKSSSGSDFVGIKPLKKKQGTHLGKLLNFAKKNEWKHLQTHTMHPDSGFDWWMFPIDHSSSGYGTQYQLSHRDIETLKKDARFIKNYRKGVILVTKSWGWDLESNKDITNSLQYWTNYQVRLGKMAYSLTLFDQKDLLTSLRDFVQTKNIDLEAWIKPYLA